MCITPNLKSLNPLNVIKNPIKAVTSSVRKGNPLKQIKNTISKPFSPLKQSQPGLKTVLGG